MPFFMSPKPFLTFAILSTLTFSLLGCQQNPGRYIFQEDKAIEKIHDEDSLAVYGVFSDIHGETEKLQTLTKSMLERGVEGFLVLGDTPQNDVLRSGGNQKERRNDTEEMIKAYTLLAKTGLPVLIIPGNHETKTEYTTAIKEVVKKYGNVIDLATYRIVDGDDVDFISLPGYQVRNSSHEVEDMGMGKKFTITQKFIPDDGYFASAEMITATGNLRRGLDDAVILLTHGPPKTFPKDSYFPSNSDSSSNSTPYYLGPGTIFSGEDVGDENTRKMMREKDIHFALSGHIHEAGGLAATLNGESVQPRTWAEESVVNVGCLEDWRLLDETSSKGMAVILTVNGTRAKYELVKVK